MRHRDPICRRGSLIQRVRNRRRTAAALTQLPAFAIPPPDPTRLRRAWPPRSAKRPRRMGLCSEVADGGENLEDHPALASRYVCRKAPVSACKLLPRQIRPGPVEPFSFHADKILPGTLHHSGIRPAPPSDHTPLARRSAFCARRTGAWNSKARAGLKRLQRGFSPCRGAARYLSAHEPWNFAIPLPLCRGTGDFHESRRRRICAHEIGNPGLLEVAISDRRPGKVGKDLRLALSAMRRVQLRIDRKLKHAARQLTS